MEEYIQTRLLQQRIAATVADIRRDPKAHPLRKSLLKAELLPYQLDGIAFAAAAGRAILADDMGLGKTIQGIGMAELLARQAGIREVLIVCPASVKSQWRSEILRFSERDCQIVLGGAEQRAFQYENGCFFTICNYEQVLRDILAIERAKWDLIVLDEGQRIKNWEAKTTRTMKSLRSPFALVLSGITSGIEELKQRLEVLLGAEPHAAVDETEKHRQQQAAERLARRSRMAEAGGQLLTAAFALLGEMIPQRVPTNGAAQMASEFKARLEECLERDEQGRPRLTVTLPNEAALENLARSVAALLTSFPT